MSRSIGTAPRYVGFEEGGEIPNAFIIVPVTNPNLGQLTKAVRRKPYGTYVFSSPPYALFHCHFFT